MTFIVSFCKAQKISVSEYFKTDTPYPNMLRHYQSGKLHRWVFTYYAYKINSILFKEMPRDIIEHAIGDDYEEKINIWWLQLINNDKALSLITNFFERTS